MTRRLPVLTAIVACGALLAPAGVAEAAAKKSSKPSIKRVTPMRVTVGKTLTVRGTNFSSSRRRNTVLFSAGKRSAFAKPTRASRKKLVVRIPASVENLLDATKKGKATRLKLRVVTKSYGRLTTLRLSPIVVSALRQGKAAPCADDDDLLSRELELRYALDPCKKDTDGDGAEDGWEYWAAKDLNVKAVPFPGKKPYPNPLQAGDTQFDFDGDFLNAGTEFRLWAAAGRSFDPARANNGRRDSVLGYSDGTQTSRPEETPAIPNFRVFTQLGSLYPARYARVDDGIWEDSERDGDADGLSNYVEIAGPGRQSWWTAYFAKKEPNVVPWPDTYFGPFSQRPFADVEGNDPDVDGDTLLDAEDDQDNDDILNVYEMYDPIAADPNNGRRKNAFNPCAPARDSRTCPNYDPL